VLHTYALGPEGYLPRQTIRGDDLVQVDAPFPVRVAPSAWL